VSDTPQALVPHPHAWADYGLAPAQGARLFSAAAAFYRAAPWKHLAETSALRATVADTAPRDVHVFGNAGTEVGISLLVPEETAMEEWLHSNPYDDESLSQSYVTPIDALFGLTFTPIDDLAPSIRKELAESGWEIASPAAYPSVEFRGKAPVSVRQREVETLIALLQAIPRFVSARQRARAGEPDAWTDHSSGVVIEDAPEDRLALLGLWETPLDLEPCQPEGPGARPGAQIRPENEQHAAAIQDELLARFAAYLQCDRTLSNAAARRQVALAQPFAEFLVQRGIPPQAINERDLRDFLYDWFPRAEPDSAFADGVPGALRRFFAFLNAADGVRCPWANAILTNRHAFRARIASRPTDESTPEWSRWRQELQFDLELRLLVPVGVPEDGIAFGEHVGDVQVTIIRELLRQWLLWRDEAIRSGRTAHESVLCEVLERQRIWERTPHPLVGGETPALAVAREQEAIRSRTRR
jgi:hypothetical protein